MAYPDALGHIVGQFPFLKKLFADTAYAGPVFHDGLANIMPNLVTEIVRRSDRAKGSVVLPERWIVERTIGWFGRCRRWQRTGKISTTMRSHSSASPPYA